MPGVDSSSASAYPHASDQTIVGYILIALVIFAAMALIFRSLFKLARAARRLDKADLKSAAAVASEGEVSRSTSAGTGVGNHNTQHFTHRLKSAIPQRWDDIDDKLDEFERLTVKCFGNAKRYAVRTLQYMGVMEKVEHADEEGGVASDSLSKAKDKWRLTAGYFNKPASSSFQHQHQHQQPEDPANRTADSDLELDLEDTSKLKQPSLDLSSAPTLQYQPHALTPGSKEQPTPAHKLKEVRRITAIDILEALAKVGRMSLSLSSYTNTYTEKMDSLLPRVSRDSKASVSPLALESGNTIKAKEWRRLTAIDYLSKLVAAIPDRNKPLPHRPISVVGSVHSHVSVEGVVVDVGVSPPPPLALAVISEEDLEGGGGVLSACESDGPTARQPADEDDGKQADAEKDALPVTHASANHRRSMTLPLQAMPHLNLALGLSSSPLPSLGPSKAGEASLQAEKDGQVISKSEQESGEAKTTTEDPPDLRPTSDIPHITALAELAASIVGDHPDAPPILDRVASLTLASPSSSPYSLPPFTDTSALSLDPDSLSPLGAPLHTPIQNYTSKNQQASKFAWAGNTHRTTFGLITRANVPPTPPRLAMFVGGDGGDVGFRSNAGSVVRVVGGKGSMSAGREQKSLGADTGIVLVQTDLGRGVGVRGSANGNGNGNGNVNVNATATTNANANGSTNAAASPTGNPLPNTNTNPLANENPNTTASPNATSSPNASATPTVIGPELVEKEKEAVSELQVQVHESENEGQLGEGGQPGSEGQVRKDSQVEKEDQMGKEGQGQVAKDGQATEEQVATRDVAGQTATGGAIGKTSTPAQPGTTTTTTGKPSAPTQTPQPPAPVQASRPSASVPIGSRLSTPVQSARLAVPLRPTRGKENRYLAGEQPRSVRRPPSQLRNVLCAI